MDFQFNQETEQLKARLQAFMDDHVVPRIGQWHEEVEQQGIYPPSFMADLKALAKSEGLWNLFLPGLKDDEPGTRLTNLEYAPLAEVMGRVHWASEIFNCNAPDTGNMELLHLVANDEQRERWLNPLLEGEIRSAFAMTEPDVASSDATNIQTLIQRDGDDYVINGRKWFITGAAHPDCKILVVMGQTNPDADVHQRQSMVLVPIDTAGVEVERNIQVMNHHTAEGHCEILFRNVRVPVTNLLGSEGSGFALAQARLGPGRVHHCMRSIGMAELALELMSDRVQERKTFGRYLHEHGTVAEWIALSRMEIDQTRLLVLRAAWMIDNVGPKAARKEIGMIKVAAGRMLTQVANRAMQAFGAMGLSPDTPLANIWSGGRMLQLADGPDEVHLRTLARMELKDRAVKRGDSARYMTLPDRT
ncbi:acyl-CoA dehydrogenase family protein [Aestuariirhabdus haliotis]|uniref:acyl-CoA dehydrogenase family protein n=1 Tax=Aestuariirhabdus haliotis TaxID=2918751 RepID=UPI0020BFF3B5|nr:acyl-CoA dehydrogenase family protein [Aestuariirhabdus haliotis]MCL6418116.1 acyl-CoA dehydrogenase family protein [Aestuariirhabdus haliotis]